MLAVEWPLSRAIIDEEGATEPCDSVAEASEKLRLLKELVPAAIRRHGGRREWEARTSALLEKARLPYPTCTPASRAYYKLQEILLSCGIPKTTRSLHLGEAPGGFVQAVGERAVEGWTWLAVSLDSEGCPTPKTENMPPGGGFARDLPCHGDLRLPECSEEIVRRCGVADLVTGDAAVEMDHSILETSHIPLLVAQANLAVRCLERGGSFVCKFYEGCLPETQMCLARLTTRFRSVGIVKPSWSKVTNSERYVVCRGFEGNAEPLRMSGRICSLWVEEVGYVVARQCSEQVVALKRALGKDAA